MTWPSPAGTGRTGAAYMRGVCGVSVDPLHSAHVKTMGGPRLPQCVGGVASFGERKVIGEGNGGWCEREGVKGRV
eukprot:361033-Chlamydomonas_euryale.AAC.1